MAGKVKAQDSQTLVSLGYTEEEWNKLPRGKRWRLLNPDKYKSAQKQWRNKQGKEAAYERARHYWLLSNYNLSQEDYDAMLKEQNNQCAICGSTRMSGRWARHAVDHCHLTGEVRGLLCNECNRGIGLLSDDPDILRAAADYLDFHRKKTHG